MGFHDVLFPECLTPFLVCGSEFSTSKITSASGREIRNLDCAWSRNRYLLKDCLLSRKEFDIFNNFFKARRGSRFAFMLWDFADHAAQRQILGRGPGVQRDFQLCKSYYDEKYPYLRKITRINRESLKIYLGEAEIQNWQIEEKTGMVTLEAPLVEGQILYASFEFYLAVRFVEDSFNYHLGQDGTIEILNVSLMELIE